MQKTKEEIKKLHKKAKSKIQDNKLILTNFSYLSILQIFNLVLPLISYPYLIRVLGAEKYGVIVFVQSVIAYFTILVNYGFNISATKEVSIHRDSKEKLREIVSSVLIIKALLFIFSLILLVVLILIIPEFRKYYLLYFFSLGLTFNEVVFPVWYFQGVEKMKYITYINIISRSLFTILIFLLIRSENDYLFVPLFSTFGAILGGIFSLYLIFFKEKLRLFLPKIGVVYKYFISSSPFFFSRASAIINIRTNALIIGRFLGYKEVAYYDLALKLSELFKIPYSLINQTIYPSVAKNRNMIFMKKVIKYTLITSIILYVAIVIGNKYLILLLGGAELLPAKYVVIILAITVPLSSISYFLGNTVLVVMDKVRYFNFSIIYAAVAYLLSITILLLTNNVDLYTVTWVVVFVELYTVLYRYYYIKKFKLI